MGCRERAERSRLLRVVARVQDDEKDSVPVVVLLLPDLRRRLPGRGAWVHPDLGCLELAVRRRSFPRALRVQGPVDVEAVRAAITSSTSTASTKTNSTTTNTVEIGSGSASDGHPMSSQR